MMTDGVVLPASRKFY